MGRAKVPFHAKIRIRLFQIALKEALNENPLVTQEALAAFCKVERSAVVKWLNGEMLPSKPQQIAGLVSAFATREPRDVAYEASQHNYWRSKIRAARHARRQRGQPVPAEEYSAWLEALDKAYEARMEGRRRLFEASGLLEEYARVDAAHPLPAPPFGEGRDSIANLDDQRRSAVVAPDPTSEEIQFLASVRLQSEMLGVDILDLFSRFILKSATHPKQFLAFGIRVPPVLELMELIVHTDHSEANAVTDAAIAAAQAVLDGLDHGRHLRRVAKEIREAKGAKQ